MCMCLYKVDTVETQININKNTHTHTYEYVYVLLVFISTVYSAHTTSTMLSCCFDMPRQVLVHQRCSCYSYRWSGPYPSAGHHKETRVEVCIEIVK